MPNWFTDSNYQENKSFAEIYHTWIENPFYKKFLSIMLSFQEGEIVY